MSHAWLGSSGQHPCSAGAAASSDPKRVLQTVQALAAARGGKSYAKHAPGKLPGIPDYLLWSSFGGYIKAKRVLCESLWCRHCRHQPPLHPLPWGCPGAHWPGRGFPGSRTPRTPRPSRREKQSTIRDVAVPLCSRRGWELILPLTGEMERLRLTKQLHNNSRGTMIEIKSSLKLLSNPTHE